MVSTIYNHSRSIFTWFVWRLHGSCGAFVWSTTWMRIYSSQQNVRWRDSPCAPKIRKPPSNVQSLNNSTTTLYIYTITRMATVDHKTKVFRKFFHTLWFLSAPRSSRHIPSKAPSQRPIKRLKRCVAPCTLEMPWSFTTDGDHLHRGWTNIQWMNMFFEYPIHSITVPSLAIPNTKVETSVKLLHKIQSSSATFCSVQSLWNHFPHHNLCSRHGATGSKCPYR